MNRFETRLKSFEFAYPVSNRAYRLKERTGRNSDGEGKGTGYFIEWQHIRIMPRIASGLEIVVSVTFQIIRKVGSSFSIQRFPVMVNVSVKTCSGWNDCPIIVSVSV